MPLQKHSLIPTAVLTLSIFFICNAAFASVHSSDTGFVYVMTNDPSGNSVIQYRRASDGTLSKLSEAATDGLGGTGNGVGALDPLGSQDSLVLSGDGEFLLAVNAGSDQLSALSANSSSVHLLNTISSNGSFPNSVALSGNLVYVLNAHGTPNISGFRLGSNGLTPIADSTMSLPGGSSAIPHDIRFSLDGTRLLVAEDGTNRIDIFDLNNDGLPTAVHSQPSAGKGPFGLKFGRNGILLSTEATTNSVSSYILTSDDKLSIVSPAVENGQQATCWLSLAADGKFIFVSNTGSGDLSTYSVSGRGTVNLEQAVAANADGGNPIDSAFSIGNSYLYAVDTSMGRILVYRVHGASIALVGTVAGLPATVQGIAAQ